MSKHKFTNAVCIVIIAAMLFVTVMFCMGSSLGITVSAAEMPYVEKLFSTDRVHSLNIVMDAADWSGLLENASTKEYVACDVVIDGEAFKNVGLRTKGNSTLSSILSSDSDRYSFKIEFDHYNKNETYYGLDKLALNNIAQDNTYLKDYISYTMMDEFQAYSPLCSFIYITVNGTDWGLYLAVEGIEDAFAQRSFDTSSGKIYKPDSMDMMNGNMGGADGENREMPNFNGGKFTMPGTQNEDGSFTMPGTQDNGGLQNQTPPQNGANDTPGESSAESAQTPSGGENADNQNRQPYFSGDMSEIMGKMGGGMGAMGSSGNDVALIYTDDSYDSYSHIFDGAITDISNSDKDRLISSIKQLNAGENLEEVVNIDEVLRYFVVHNYLLNFDSYTGSMMHNYYLYENNGQLSMIAWDYNLSFGAFAGGMGGGGFTQEAAGADGTADNASAGPAATVSADSATTQINYPIDTPVSGTTLEDRPLLGKLLSNETYLEKYHTLFSQFISEYFDSGEFEQEMDRIIALISPYVEKDPSAFCTYEAFLTASQNLKEFCLLRTQSVKGQLDGSIPSTSEGQSADSSSFVDGSSIDFTSLGSSSTGFGGDRGGMGNGNNPFGNSNSANTQNPGAAPSDKASPSEPAAGESAVELPFESSNAAAVTTPQIMLTAAGNNEQPQQAPQGDAQGGFSPPADGQMPQGGDFPEGEMPEIPEGGQMPGDRQNGAQPWNNASAAEDSTAQSSAGTSESENSAGQSGTESETAGGGNTGGQTRQGGGAFTFPGGTTTNTSAAQTTDTQAWVWIGISALILALGLLFAKRFRVRR